MSSDAPANSPAAPDVLVVQNLYFDYTNEAQAQSPVPEYVPAQTHVALDNISFRIPAGSYVALAGHNGSGKTTLAKCIANLLAPQSGTISIMPQNERFLPRARLVFQNPAQQIFSETVDLDIAFGLENNAIPRPEMHKRINEILSRMELDYARRYSVESLSIFETQILASAGMLVLMPAILIVDEPTAHLSSDEKKTLLAQLRAYCLAGGTIVHVTHSKDEMCFADRVILLHEGILVFDGAPSALFEQALSFLQQYGLIAADTQNPVSPLPANTPSAITCEQVSNFSLQDFSYHFKKGAITAICGASGSGKTLLLNTLAGLVKPQAGRIRYAEDASIMLCVQDAENALFEEFVADDIAYALKARNTPEPVIREALESVMNMVGLPFEQFKNRKTHTLSGGEKRRAALAGNLISNSDILLLDSPCSGLDMHGVDTVLHILNRLRAEGKTIIVTSPAGIEAGIADECVLLYPPKNDTKLRQAVRQDSAYPLLSLATSAIAIATAIAARSVSALLALVGFEIAGFSLAAYTKKKRLHDVYKSMILPFFKTLPWIAFVLGIQYLFSKNLLTPLQFFLHFVAVYIPLLAYVFLTNPTQIMHGIEDALFPLKYAQVPSRHAAFLVALIIRFIALLHEELARIQVASDMRGGTKKKKGLSQKLMRLASLFLPLILRTLARADALAESLSARDYNAKQYSRFAEYRASALSVFFLICSIIIFIALVFFC